MYVPAADPYIDDSEADEPFEWDVQGGNWFDAGAEALGDVIRELSPVVVAVDVDAFGGLRLTMSAGIELAIFPDVSFPREHWRYFQPGPDDRHLVVMDETCIG
jgi:hypothetical protein